MRSENKKRGWTRRGKKKREQTIDLIEYRRPLVKVEVVGMDSTLLTPQRRKKKMFLLTSRLFAKQELGEDKRSKPFLPPPPPSPLVLAIPLNGNSFFEKNGVLFPLSSKLLLAYSLPPNARWEN
ncbi:hypothetical protein TNIN_460901 [Trichonephila inaurata madagascariensis]|uniref:Uncharacterized protein n=1 Tax=Trichonephila inaurata madagascariensis TaxID=2747483 RepID=A0A8X6WQV1_9ARAC|nr:hypothetical protein TNIN_460901 [Trichonephila inaurata madagascariensis]